MIVGACIARPLTGNIFFLSKIGVIGTLAFAGDQCDSPVRGISRSLRDGGGFKLHNKKTLPKNGSVFYIACEANLATA